MKHSDKKQKILILGLYLFLFLACSVLFWQTPCCHDEWQWAQDARIELMKKGFKNYNGRYLGNILALVIVRNMPVRAMLLGGFTAWMVYLIQRTALNGIFSEKDHAATGLFSFLTVILLFLMPKTLYAQSFGWSAAYVNFIPPVFLMLLWFLLFDEAKEKTPGKGKLAGFFVLTFCIQLFSEHITLLFAGCSFFCLLLACKKEKQLRSAALVSFGGAFFGALLMFSNGAYRRAAEHKDGYKRIGASLKSMYDQLNSVIIPHAFYQNTVLILVLSFLLLLLMVFRKRKGFFDQVSMIVLAGGAGYVLWMSRSPKWVFLGNETWNTLLHDLIAVSYVAAVFYSIFRVLPKEERGMAAGLWFLSYASCAPLLVAAPIGPRCFFITYAFGCTVALRLLAVYLRDTGTDPAGLLTGAGVFAGVLLFVYLRMFAMVGAADRQRFQSVQDAVEAGRPDVILHYLPYHDYYWTTEPPAQNWISDFRYFYGIPEGITYFLE